MQPERRRRTSCGEGGEEGKNRRGDVCSRQKGGSNASIDLPRRVLQGKGIPGVGGARLVFVLQQAADYQRVGEGGQRWADGVAQLIDGMQGPRGPLESGQ